MHHLIERRVWDGDQAHGRMQLKDSGRRGEAVWLTQLQFLVSVWKYWYCYLTLGVVGWWGIPLVSSRADCQKRIIYQNCRKVTNRKSCRIILSEPSKSVNKPSVGFPPVTSIICFHFWNHVYFTIDRTLTGRLFPSPSLFPVWPHGKSWHKGHVIVVQTKSFVSLCNFMFQSWTLSDQFD